jgi:hydroxymethylpyrimidine/phosphomethylpyrimidine kinase
VSADANPPVALTIAGSDSAAGAGIQADIKTMSALGVFATTAVTAVTAQNTAAVVDVHYLPADMVGSQIRAVLDDLPVASVKTGLLGTAPVIETVGRLAASGRLPRLVVDPVMVASTGRSLLADEGLEAYRRDLIPHALVVTPNLWEAALLAGVPYSEVQSIEAMVEVAREIHRLGPTWVLVKGGHLPGVEPRSAGQASGEPSEDRSEDRHDRSSDRPDEVADVLFDGTNVIILQGRWVDTANTHGTGCSLSSAIVAYLARGADVPHAVASAKEFVHDALVGGAQWRLGQGHGPLDHLGWTRGTAAVVTPPR